MDRSNLTDDQNEAIDRLYNFDETFLIAPTGAGKTAIALTAISELILAGELSRVLVIAPLKVCLTTWSNEAEKWDHLKWGPLKGLEVAIACGSPKERLMAVESSAQIIVLNEENVEWLLSFGTGWPMHSFDGLVIDETSRWTGSATGRKGGKRYKALRKVVKGFAWRVGMTAEPVSEDWVRLFGQLRLIDLGKALGTSKDRYLKKYFFPTDWENRNWEIFPGRENAIADRIRPVCHVMPDYKADTLPEKRITYHEIELPKEAFRRYNRMRIDRVLEVEGEVIEAGSAAVLSGKLEQIAAGFSYIDDEDADESGRRGGAGAWIYHHDEKIIWAADRGSEILASGESVILVYWFNWEREQLREAFPEALEINGTPKQIQSAMAQWREKPGQLMLLQPSSASHGVDGLQDTCHRQLWLGPIWSKDKTNQCGDRLWRRGQTHAVEIEVAIALGTIDEVKRASVEYKGDYHELFLEHLGVGPDGLTPDEREGLSDAM